MYLNTYNEEKYSHAINNNWGYEIFYPKQNNWEYGLL